MSGKAAKEGEFPYFLRIYSKWTDGAGIDHEIDCGASLIDTYFAITAAHCVKPVQVHGGTISILGGVTKFSGEYRGTFMTSISADKLDTKYIFVPQLYEYNPAAYNDTKNGLDFNPSAESYDIALLYIPLGGLGVPTLSIPDPTSFTDPEHKDYPELKYSTSYATYIGLGSTDNSGIKISRQLQYADITLQWVSWYNQTKNFGKYFSRFITYPDYWFVMPHVCNGDSGGPVVIRGTANDPTKIYFIGVIIGGGTSCTDRLNIATSIAYYSQWILETTKLVPGHEIKPNSGTAKYTPLTPYPTGTVLNRMCFNQTKGECALRSAMCEWKNPDPSQIDLTHIGTANVDGVCQAK